MIKKNGLKSVIPFLFILILTFILYQSTVSYLIGIWNDIRIGEYAHGYLVLAISAWLIYESRHQLARQQVCTSFIGLMPVFLAMLLWLAATLVSVEMLQSVALLLLVIGLVWVSFGLAVTRIVLFPLLFIGFALPVWSPLSVILQNVTADVVFWLVRLFEVPATRQENLIIVPYGELSIEEACSGLRYLLAALTLGTLYAYINYTRLSARLLVVFISAAAAVLANIIRVFIVVYVAYTSDMQADLVRHHLMMGWYLFGAVVAVLLVVDVAVYRLRQHKNNPVVDTNDSNDNSDGKGHRSADLSVVEKVCKKTPGQQYLTILLAVIIMAIGPFIVQQTHHGLDVANSKPLHQQVILARILPSNIKTWQKTKNTNDWHPVYANALELKQSYRKGGHTVTMYIAYYAGQAQGKELINETNHITNDRIWRSFYMHAHKQQVGQQDILVQILEKPGAKHKLLWYQFCVAEWCTNNKYKAKILQLAGLLNGHHEAYVIAITTDIETNDTAGIRSAGKILKDFYFSLKSAIPVAIKKMRNVE